MDACKISAMITALANHFYANLSQEEFEVLNVVVSELSKSMFSMSLLRGICKAEGGK